MQTGMMFGSRINSQFFCVVVTFFALFFVHCDNNPILIGNTPNPNATEPTLAVATNVGPVEQLLTNDVLVKANAIRDDIAQNVSDLFGNPNDSSFLRFIAGDADDQISTTTLDFSESTLGCDSGGTRTVIGSATLTYNTATNSGAILGEYTFQYDNCQDIVVLQTSNGSCAVTPTVDGELPVTINISFELESENFEQYVSDETLVDAGSVANLQISVGSSASQQFYTFQYYLTDISSNTNFTGTVSYQTLLYDLPSLETFISNTATTAICN